VQATLWDICGAASEGSVEKTTKKEKILHRSPKKRWTKIVHFCRGRRFWDWTSDRRTDIIDNNGAVGSGERR
jgi:hypothetical protein